MGMGGNSSLKEEDAPPRLSASRNVRVSGSWCRNPNSAPNVTCQNSTSPQAAIRSPEPGRISGLLRRRDAPRRGRREKRAHHSRSLSRKVRPPRDPPLFLCGAEKRPETIVVYRYRPASNVTVGWNNRPLQGVGVHPFDGHTLPSPHRVPVTLPRCRIPSGVTETPCDALTVTPCARVTVPSCDGRSGGLAHRPPFRPGEGGTVPRSHPPFSTPCARHPFPRCESPPV